MDLNRSHQGHAHFWMRPITRRGFLGSAALAGGAAATAGAWLPQVARADFDGVATVFPKPIPFGVAPFNIPIHHVPPVPSNSSHYCDRDRGGNRLRYVRDSRRSNLR